MMESQAAQKILGTQIVEHILSEDPTLPDVLAELLHVAACLEHIIQRDARTRPSEQLTMLRYINGSIKASMTKLDRIVVQDEVSHG